MTPLRGMATDEEMLITANEDEKPEEGDLDLIDTIPSAPQSPHAVPPKL